MHHPLRHSVSAHGGLLRPGPPIVAVLLVLSILHGQPVAAGSGLPPARVPALAAASPRAGEIDTGRRGPWAVGHRDVDVPGPAGSFPASVAFPTTGPMDPATGEALAAPGRHPAIVFGHGYLGQVEWYTAITDHLASWGFIVVAPRSGLGLFPDHEAFAADFSRVLDWLETEASRPGSWLEGRVAPGAFGASGHSMGGGAAVVAAARDPRFATVATLAAAESRPGAIEAAADVRSPMLFVAGDQDAITPLDEHQRPMFEAAGGPAQLAVLQGGSHCGFLYPPDLAGLVCDVGTLGRDEQVAAANRLLAAWFLVELAGRDDLRGVAWPDQPERGVAREIRGENR